MDDDRLDLIRRLCTEAGVIFEDASAEAVLIGRVSPDNVPATIAGLRQEAGRATDILGAAAALAVPKLDQPT